MLSTLRVVVIQPFWKHHAFILRPLYLIYKRSDCDIRQELLDIARWFGTLPFKRIYVIAGNHDTPLDIREYPEHSDTRDAFLHALPDHATLLENGGDSYRGIFVWGSPYLISREEVYRKRYYSNAFERRAAEREGLWQELPDNLDVLMVCMRDLWPLARC